MQRMRFCFVLLTSVLSPGFAPAGVVINEILYHAPNDLDRLQFIELFNAGDTAVDLSGWQLRQGARFEFPSGARIDADGYLVVCKDKALFRKAYGFDAAGQFEGVLSHRGGRIELIDAKGKRSDNVRYGSRAPWPLAADGCSSSLERICPTKPADRPENWAPSPLPAGAPKPGGTPGKKNTSHSAHLPPIISKVTAAPAHVAPDQVVKVEADVRSDKELRAVELRYRVAGSGYEKPEQTLPMTKLANGRYAASIPAQKPAQIIRYRVHVVDMEGGERFHPSPNDVRPAFSVYVHEPFMLGRCPFGLIINVGETEYRVGKGSPALARFFGNLGQPNAPPARGRSAFVYVDQKTGVPQLFDFINVTPRTAGVKVRFNKDQPLRDMTTINLIYEYMDRFVLAEPLAYETYRKAGNAAPRTDFVRTWVDGRPIGLQLLVEQPNKAFLRHNKLNADGNMYKIIWWANDVVSAHEKKTHLHDGHADIVKIIEQLNTTQGDAQWEVIKKNFDVEQVINYFAVNMLLSHWDGYFNNYFAYRDVFGTGKWTMYPWDQDKTWGFHDGIQGYGLFYDMPITFGTITDRPIPSAWWRPGGFFSKPILSNPTGRKLFLARTKELLEKVYTEDVFFPLIKEMGERLEDEVKVRAAISRADPKRAVEHLHRNLDTLREHLTKRRAFLLDQNEIKNAGKFDRAELKE